LSGRWTQKIQTLQFGNCSKKNPQGIIKFVRKLGMQNIGSPKMFNSSNEFSMYIEQIVHEKKITYMEAVLQYCKENFIEPEDIAKLVNKSLKDKLEVNFQDENYLPKKATLNVE
jgi:hypothetical protein